MEPPMSANSDKFEKLLVIFPCVVTRAQTRKMTRDTNASINMNGNRHKDQDCALDKGKWHLRSDGDRRNRMKVRMEHWR